MPVKLNLWLVKQLGSEAESWQFRYLRTLKSEMLVHQELLIATLKFVLWTEVCAEQLLVI